MVERPDIDEERLISTLRQSYHLSLLSITFLPVGNDATAWLFRIDTMDDATYLLKLKRGPIEAASLSVPHYLYNHGFAAVVAPLPAADGRLAVSHGDFTLILYPFIAGETGMALGLAPAQWQAFGLLLQQLHATSPSDELLTQLRRESFTLYWYEIMQTLEQRIASRQSTDPIARALAMLWQERHAEIWAIVERTMTLGRHLQAAPPPFVLCHADIHTANVLVDPSGALHIVDWDGILLAPKERDLIFVTERATIQHPQERNFFSGYGETVCNPLAFAYYRYEWVVQELADNGSRILLRIDLDEPTRVTALHEIRQLFAPGDVVDVAYATEADM